MAKPKKFSANSLTVLKLSSIPTPTFKEVRGKDYISYGEDNLFPKLLIELLNKSAKHNAIITGKINYISGDGVEVNGAGLTIEQKAVLKSFLDNINSQGEDIVDLLNKIAADLTIFGGIALEVIYTKGSERVAELNHIDFGRVRSDEDNKRFWFTKDWSVFRPEQNEDFKEFQGYDPKVKKGVQLFYFKEYRPNADVYPLPDYIGALDYIATDVEIANFHYTSTANGFVGGTLINFFNGEPEPEEQRTLERKLKEKFAGTDNANSIIMNFADSKDRAAEIIALRPNDFDKQFDILNRTVQQEIFTAHRITSPMLFGVKTEGQLGGRTELIDAYELFTNTYVRSKQVIIERILNELIGLNGVSDRLEIKTLPPIVEKFTEATMVSVMTKNEIRERLGLKPLEVEDETLTPTSEVAMGKHSADVRKIIKIVDRFGAPAKDFLTLKTKPAKFSSEKEAELTEALAFAQLTGREMRVLDLIRNQPQIESAQIADILKIKPEDIVKIVDDLTERGFIKVGQKDGVLNRTINAEARTLLDQNLTTEIFIHYRYVVAPGAGAAIIPGTRDFCRQLLGLNKVFTRTEIDQIGKTIETELDAGSRDLWRERGGFYTRPEGGALAGVTTPYCRHIWQQELNIKKNG